MIPIKGSDPKINVVSIGAKILDGLAAEKAGVEHIILSYSSTLDVSVDHIILSLDWLFAINAINCDGVEVCINEA